RRKGGKVPRRRQIDPFPNFPLPVPILESIPHRTALARGSDRAACSVSRPTRHYLESTPETRPRLQAPEDLPRFRHFCAHPKWTTLLRPEHLHHRAVVGEGRLGGVKEQRARDVPSR